ncbi:MAG: metalloprotease PmbA, partial [Gammaproteobacteria bacterium]
EKATSISRFTTQDQFAGLADADLMAKAPPDLDLYHPWDLNVEAAEALALRAEDAARRLDARIKNSEGATASTGGGFRVYGNSHGFCNGYATTSHSISCSVIADSGGCLERDYWYTVSRSPDGLDTPEQVGEKAAQRALSRLGARQLTTQVVPVLFPAELARGLFGYLVAAIRGSAQYRQASFLLNARGEQLFPEFVDIEEDPLIPRGLASAPFDSEGVGTKRRMLVEKGVLQGYVLSSYSARRLGEPTTANAGGVHNLVVRPTVGEADDLIANAGEVFIVSELLGQGVNTVTGDYSRGAAGFWVKDGEILYPVNEVTIAGNLRQLFRGIQAIGADVDFRGTTRCGSMLVEGLTVAGQ